MAAPVVQTSQQTNQSTAGTVNAAAPSGISDGDLLLALHHVSDLTATSPTVGRPGTWALQREGSPGTRSRGQIISKIASGESGTYAFTANQTLDHIAFIMRILGAHPTNFINAIDHTTDVTTTHTCPDIITTVPDCLILYICCEAQTTTAFTGFPSTGTSLASMQFSGETGQRCNIYQKNQASAGNTGTGVYTHATNKACVNFTVAIAPVSAGYQFRGAYL